MFASNRLKLKLKFRTQFEDKPYPNDTESRTLWARTGSAQELTFKLHLNLNCEIDEESINNILFIFKFFQLIKSPDDAVQRLAKLTARSPSKPQIRRKKPSPKFLGSFRSPMGHFLKALKDKNDLSNLIKSGIIKSDQIQVTDCKSKIVEYRQKNHAVYKLYSSDGRLKNCQPTAPF